MNVPTGVPRLCSHFREARAVILDGFGGAVVSSFLGDLYVF